MLLEFINQIRIQSYNPSRMDFARPHDSTAGIEEKPMMWIFWICVIFALYVVYRVRRELKKEYKKKR